MIEENKKQFRQTILREYNLIKDSFNPTPTKIRDRLLEIIEKKFRQNESTEIIKGFLRIENEKELKREIKKEGNLNYYRTIQNFLISKKLNPQITKEYLLEIADLLVSYSPNKSEFLSNFIDKYLNDYKFNSIQVFFGKSKLKRLPMEEYYNQLSYIEQDDFHNRQKIAEWEKESLSAKFKRKTNITSELSKDYISKAILNNNKRIVIAGNPGVGKSTYARWLCNNWALKQEQKNLLIYIQLRDLKFEENNYILKYIAKEYFNNILETNISLENLLNSTSSHHFILDGFDEINLENQYTLINDFSPYNFIILSRPYGLINHRFDNDASFHIDGFNNTIIKKYIKAVLDIERKKFKSRKQLLEIIEKNIVLTEFRHIPLMLSYITFIYLKSDKPEEDLLNIDSTYDLQEKVYYFLFIRNNTKGKQISSEKISKLSELASKMELDKTFIYKIVNDDPDIELVNLFNELGVGGVTQEDQFITFSFYSVTFQEFFSTKFLDKKISTEAFKYLLEDRFFWNLCFMLIGKLSQKAENSDFINEVLKIIDKKFRNKITYDRYMYYLFLSECDKITVNKIVDENILNELFNLKAMTQEGYIFWYQTVLHSVRRLIHKFSPSNYSKFQKIVLNKMKIYSINDFQKQRNYGEYLEDIIVITKFNYEESFRKKIINHMIKLVKKATLLIESPEINEDYGEYLYSEFIHYRNTLLLTPDILASSKDDLEKLLEMSFSSYRPILVECLNYVSPIDSLLLEGEKKKIDLIKNMGSIKIFTFFYDEYILPFCEICEQLIDIYGIRRENIPNEDKDKILALIEFITNWSINHLSAKDYYEIEHATNIIVSALIDIDEPGLYDTLIKFIHILKIKDGNFPEIPNNKLFVNYIKKNIQNFNKNPSIINIEKLDICFRFKNTIREGFIYLREDLIAVLKKIVSLIQDQENKNIENNKNQSYLDTLLLISKIPSEQYDKKFFIDSILNSKYVNHPFIKKNIVFALITGDDQGATKSIIIYESKYWNFLISYLEQNQWDSNLLFNILNNESIYTFPANYFYIKIIIHHLAKNIIQKDKEYIKSKELNYLKVSSNVLLSLKYIDRKNWDNILDNISTILCNSIIVDAYLSRYYINTKIIVSYIIFYYYRPTKDFPLSISNSLNLFENQKKINFNIKNSLAQFFCENNVFLESEINRLLPILNQSFINDIRQIAIDNLLINGKFNKEEFNRLLL